MRHSIPLLFLLCVPTISSARDNTAERTKARQDIQSLFARLASAEKAGDAAAVSLCYDGDGLLLPSSGEPVKGREDISKRYQAMFAGKTPRLPLESEELWVMDDWAVSRGATRSPSTRKNAKGPVKSRYVMTLKRRGDAWEIQSLVWNSTAE